MTDADKMARALVDGLRLHPSVTLTDAEADEAVRLTAPGFASALRAARNEGLETGAKIADELFGLGHHPMLISGALQAASAIRSKKDSGNA